MARPRAAMARPLAREAPVKPMTPASPTTPRANVSGGPKFMARLASGGAPVMSRIMLMVPARKEATAATARAGPPLSVPGSWEPAVVGDHLGGSPGGGAGAGGIVAPYRGAEDRE